MTLEVLETRLAAQENSCEIDRNKIYGLIERSRVDVENTRAQFDAKIETVKAIANAKVDSKQFWAVMGILVTALTGLFSYISVQLKDLSQTTNKVESNISFISGKLLNSDIEFQK